MEAIERDRSRFTLCIDEVFAVRLDGGIVVLDIKDGNGNLCRIRAKPHVVLSGINQCQTALLGSVIPWGRKRAHAAL